MKNTSYLNKIYGLDISDNKYRQILNKKVDQLPIHQSFLVVSGFLSSLPFAILINRIEELYEDIINETFWVMIVLTSGRKKNVY